MAPPTPSIDWRKLARWSAVSFAACVFTLTHIPVPEQLTDWVSTRDLLLHFTVYAALGWLTGAGFGRAGTWLRWQAGLLAFAAVDEFTQGWVGRTPDVRDWCSDAVGLTCGLLLARVVIRLWSRPERRS